MREILFRGQRADNKEWVYGCLTLYSEEKSHITVDLTKGEIYDVKTETIGQYAEIKDKNRKDVFKDDIISDWDSSFYIVKFKRGSFIAEHIGDVKKSCLLFDLHSEKGHHYLSENLEYLFEIIGNKHDNPELLKKLISSNN